MAFRSLLERVAKNNKRRKKKKKRKPGGRSKGFVNGNGKGPTKKRRKRTDSSRWLS